jgi:putative colanic acid biosynthesis UDP-glucose lipid carrier transferase
MKNIITRIDKNNITSFQGEYKLIRENTIFEEWNQEFYNGKDVRGIINLNSILISPIDSRPLEFRINRRLKRVFDIFFSIFITTCILTWLIPILSILIKMDSKGPVFFLQKRNKKNGRIFTCIKFRTMIVNEEADLKQAVENDSRITRIGNFLREYHLDELPQFINVLLGDMSVIGPRPHMISDNLNYDKMIDHYSYRSTVKPGISGLAQVMGLSGRITNINTMKDRVNMDNFYIRHWSLKLDMIILYRTIFKPFR